MLFTWQEFMRNAVVTAAAIVTTLQTAKPFTPWLTKKLSDIFNFNVKYLRWFAIVIGNLILVFIWLSVYWAIMVVAYQAYAAFIKPLLF
jgi:hypothetical protein